MPFMFVLLVFLLCAVVWGCFHANPHGVNGRRLLACNVVILALGVSLAPAAAIGGLIRKLLPFPLSRRSAA